MGDVGDTKEAGEVGEESGPSRRLASIHSTELGGLSTRTSAGGAPSTRAAGKRNGMLRLKVLSSEAFLCGFYFYEYRHKRPLNTSHAIAVHHNWIRGDRNKWDRATAYDTIVTDPSETRRHFLARARTSMVRKVAWQYRNPRHPGNGPAT